MKIEDQVCGFDQAEKLAYLKLKTTWCWWKTIVKGDPVTLILRSEITGKLGEFLPSPTVSELGVLLNKYQVVLHLTNGWQIFDRIGSPHFFTEFQTHKGLEAYRRAEALIWLLENGYLKPGDLKL